MKHRIPIFESPRVDIDEKIMFNTRLAAAQKKRTVTPAKKPYRIKPFKCVERGYIVGEKYAVIMYDPTLVKPEFSFLEYVGPTWLFILRDDEVVDWHRYP